MSSWEFSESSKDHNSVPWIYTPVSLSPPSKNTSEQKLCINYETRIEEIGSSSENKKRKSKPFTLNSTLKQLLVMLCFHLFSYAHLYIVLSISLEKKNVSIKHFKDLSQTK